MLFVCELCALGGGGMSRLRDRLTHEWLASQCSAKDRSPHTDGYTDALKFAAAVADLDLPAKSVVNIIFETQQELNKLSATNPTSPRLTGLGRGLYAARDIAEAESKRAETLFASDLATAPRQVFPTGPAGGVA